MRTLFILLIGVLAAGQNLYSQDSENVDLILQWNPSDVSFFNDCWGYTAPDGSEYGIVGSREHIHFFSFSDVTDIQEIERLTPGGRSTWRDFKTYQDYAYGVHDSYGTSNPEGLVIMDLSNIANGNVTYTQDESDFLRAHNIFIDTATAKLFVVGTNSQNRGMIVYDLSTDPGSPELMASVSLQNVTDGPASGYIHDVFVRNDTAYASHGNSGFWIWDFSTPSSPILLGGIDPNGSGYNHSSWLTTDSRYAFWCEETAGRKIHVADVSSPDAISVELQFNDPLLSTDNSLIAHNPFIRGDRLYISYYEDGVQIYDISDPLNPQREGYYDTDPDNTSYNGTDNNWGVYPYFSDNKILASDTDNGVFFLQYQEAFLPLELLRWEVTQQRDRQALLSWSTIQEENTSHFEIEYSVDGELFESLHRENSNNEITLNTYEHLIDELETGLHYFRLKMVDLDGSFTYSAVASVMIKSTGSDWSVFPNPSFGQLNISGPWAGSNVSRIDVSVYDATGKMMSQMTIDSEHSTVFSLPNDLSSGIYSIVLSQNGETLRTQSIQFIQ